MNGYWVVMETGQGGGIPDHVHGPYWNRDEALAMARDFAIESGAHGRRDIYQAGRVEIEDDES